MTADDYLRRVGFAIRDLPWRAQRELLAEIPGQLAELPPGADLEARLGTPEQYAADLRVAAGLERGRGPIAFLRARRPQNVVLTLVALTVLGLAIGTVAWIDSYQPLRLGDGFRPPEGTRASPTGDGEYVVFHQGRPFQYGVTVRNTGSFTVRVLGTDYVYPPGLPFSARLRMSGVLTHGGLPLASSRFHPFDLKPGEERMLLLKGVWKADCRVWAGGGSTLLIDLPLRYRFLWRTSTVRLRLPERLGIVFEKGVSCPSATR